MIYLIGGPPRCGKTILAKKLSQKVGASWISADTIESIICQYTPASEQDTLMPKNKLRRDTQNSNDLMYTRYSANQILEAYIVQSKAIWKGIEALIECMISDNQDLIIEGHQLHPTFIKQLIDKYPSNVKALILSKSNVEHIVETARLGKDQNDWFLKKSKSPDIHFKIAEMIAKYSDFYSAEALNNSIDNVEYKKSFEDQINEALGILIG